MGERSGGSFAACGREASSPGGGLKIGAPGLNGVALSSSGVPAMGEHSGGSFAACGRDAGQFSEDRRSWAERRCAILVGGPGCGERSGGRFAVCGRDAQSVGA